MTSKRVRAWVALCVLVFVAVGVGAGEAAAAPPSKSNLRWTKCFQDLGPFQCTTVQVPLDYNDSIGTISLAVVRLPAADQAHRIGSLLLNPGGPGGSGVDFTIFAGPSLFTPEVRARFDLVGFDPRGIARSTALRCFGTPRQWDPFFVPFAFPVTADEEQQWMAADLFLDGACAQRGGRIIDHMSTANVARDMDLIRAAVGDSKLTYVGYSYGSYLGQVYANMFPNNFRALVIDGVLDPIAWVNAGGAIPFSTRLRSDDGAMKTLNEFFRLCDAGGEEKCAFAPDSADRYAAMADKLLEDGPIELHFPDETVEFGYSQLIGETLGPLYDSSSWEDFAGFLAFVESEIADSAAATTFSGKFDLAHWRPGYIAKRGFPTYPNFLEGFPAVACSDGDNPDSYAVYSAAARAAGEEFGYFGPLWTWITSICAQWPGADADRYTGPFDHATQAPVLVVGNRFDPATRYEGAVTAHNLLPNSALLTVAGWGHTSLFRSACADSAIALYLIEVTTPAPGTVCDQDHVPFSGG
jgi:pimeloyl-ACP methyl ester carboxylesterase